MCIRDSINAVNAQYQDPIVSTPTGYRIAPAMAQQMLHQSPNDIPPVSYTHLDVYKRQTLNSMTRDGIR